VDRAVQRTGYADFWKLSNLNVLPMQTRNYIPAILAITIMAKNPKDYGLEGIETDAPIEYDTVNLEAATSLALVADALERPVSEVRELNPALLKGVAPQGYDLRVPRGSAHPLMAALEPVPPARRASWRMHRVEKGETLAAIARRYRTAASAIASANNSAVAAPEAGDVLLIPAVYQEKDSPVKRTAVKNVRKVSRIASRSKSSARAASAQPVSSRVLNRRAPSRRIKTASLGSSAGQ
jgi:membrane-bound lytic murein transglycosylase D